MTLKAPKKKNQPFPTPLTLTNQHGENYILVEESNKSWPNVAGEVENGPPRRLQSQWCGSCSGGKGKPHKRRFVLAQGRWGAGGSQWEDTRPKSACGLWGVITLMLNVSEASSSWDLCSDNRGLLWSIISKACGDDVCSFQERKEFPVTSHGKCQKKKLSDRLTWELLLLGQFLFLF